MRGWLAVGLGGLALGACEAGNGASPRPVDTGRAEASPMAGGPREEPSREPRSAISPESSPAGLGLPEQFTALGTEPFWAAKVTGDRLIYMTPEDQAGQTIAIAREDGAKLVELSGTLAGKPLALIISKGPCSDGMSDVVYR